MRPITLFLLVAAVAVQLFHPLHADERSTARRFEAAKRDEPSLIAFLRAMPKGADLHNHVGGALYAEDGLESAIARGLWFDPALNQFVQMQREGCVRADQLLRDERLRYQYLNAASMRGGTHGPAGGHDHFFSAFGPAASGFRGAPRELPLAIVARRARAQNLQYLELMAGPAGEAMAAVHAAARAGEPYEAALSRMQPQFDAYVAASRAEIDRWDRDVAARLDMSPPVSGAVGPITLRYLVTAIRTDPEERVFATWAAAFALMRADRRVVGVNLAAPEDAPRARSGFDGQMRLLDFLWRRFEKPNVTLHAGELNHFVSPPEPMSRHIRASIELGHARRIGHGDSVAWENDLPGLLRRMREQRIAVEVCPSSAETILGAGGDRYPFQLYRRAGVPLTINTDDEGVSRSSITLEYLKAVRWWDLSYTDLKELARNSVEYSFLPGESLFDSHDYRRVRAPYRSLKARGWKLGDADRKALSSTDKGMVQARLERAIVEFEAG